MTTLCTNCAQVLSADTAIMLYDFGIFVAAAAILLYVAPFKGKPTHFKVGMGAFYILWALVMAQTFNSLAATYYTTVIVVLDYLNRITSLGVTEIGILRVTFFSLPVLIFLNAAFYVFIHRRLARAGGEDECQ